jgi:hypothetical protein
VSVAESWLELPLLSAWPSDVVVNPAFTQVPVENPDLAPSGSVFFPDVASELHASYSTPGGGKADLQLLSCALFVVRDNFISTFYGMLFEQSDSDPAQFSYTSFGMATIVANVSSFALAAPDDSASLQSVLFRGIAAVTIPGTEQYQPYNFSSLPSLDLAGPGHWFRLTTKSQFATNQTHWMLSLQFNVTQDAVAFAPSFSKSWSKAYPRLWQ